MTGRPWTVERRDAHSARLKALFGDPAYKERKREKAAARKAAPPPERMVDPSVYDYRLDLGEITWSLDPWTIIEPPAFEALA